MDSQPDHKKNKSIGFERERTLYSASFQVFPSSTTTPQGMYRFSSDHRSQVLSGGVSTWLGDRLGIPRVVDFLDISFWVISHFLVSLSLQRFFFFFFVQLCNAERDLKMAATKTFAFRMPGVGWFPVTWRYFYEKEDVLATINHR